MSYDLYKLGPDRFENLCQSLAGCIFGDGSTAFSDGPDGGRDATFEGFFHWPPTQDLLEGYLVIQAKYKKKRGDARSNLDWFTRQLKLELDKWITTRIHLKSPDYIVFATNIALSAAPKNGGYDKITQMIAEYVNTPGSSLKGAWVWHETQIITFLDKYESVRKKYSEFTTPSEVLASLMKRLEEADIVKQRAEQPDKLNIEEVLLDDTESRNDTTSELVPVGDRLVEHFMRHKSPYEKDFSTGGKGPLGWFCTALARMLIEELGESSSSFVDKYGVYGLSKVIETRLTQSKVDPFKYFDAEALSEPLDSAIMVVNMFEAQESLWKVAPDSAGLRAHIAGKQGIIGWSMAPDPKLRLDINLDGSGSVSYGDESRGGIHHTYLLRPK